MKKLDLVYQILDYQASNPKAVKAIAPEPTSTDTPEQPKKRGEFEREAAAA